MSHRTDVVIAIDGPAASGKSTVSKRVAQKLKCTYVDSGSCYRGITWKAVRSGVNTNNEEKVLEMIRAMDWSFTVEDHSVTFTIDGEYPGDQLRSEPVRAEVSNIAALASVRDVVVMHLRDMIRYQPLVVEGRDIGSVVFPDAAYKFYLDASPEERARRRVMDIERLEGQSDVNQVLTAIRERDSKDSSRATAPLQIPLGAVFMDTTAMNLDEVVDTICGKIDLD